jgi:hypothetical protein
MEQEMEDRIAQLIREEYDLHPAAELVDHYKLFFQACCGPGHLIDDRSEALGCLRAELLQDLDNEEPLIRDISMWDNDYCRVDLKVVKNGMMSEKEFFSLFLDSVSSKILPDRFPEYWPLIESKIKELDIFGPAFITERKTLSAILGEKKDYHPRHSERFRREYNPHYRLIKKKFLSIKTDCPERYR